jgi:nucleotide-binding universal stress UspA family protein
MKNSLPALTRLLLPVKSYDRFKSILPLVELISKTMAGDLQKVDLLHVVGGSFLSTHLENLDFRAGHVLSSELMQRLRNEHYEEIVNPLLNQVQELLGKSGVALHANVRVVDGDPVKKISTICESEDYSTLILSRRKKEEETLFNGTILNGLVNRHFNGSLYIIGEEGFASGISPMARIMIGVDGSPTCLRAAGEAAVLLRRAPELIDEVSLVNVLDPSCLYDGSDLDSQQLIETGDQQMQGVEDILTKEGVDKSKIISTVLYGKPGEALTTHAQSFGATMCYVGRRNRSKIAEVLLGSVSGDFIHRCRKKTIVLVS